jgi:hypothetical protein
MWGERRGQARSLSSFQSASPAACLLSPVIPGKTVPTSRRAFYFKSLNLRRLVGIDTELAEAAAFMGRHGFSSVIGKRVVGLEA